MRINEIAFNHNININKAHKIPFNGIKGSNSEDSFESSNPYINKGAIKLLDSSDIRYKNSKKEANEIGSFYKSIFIESDLLYSELNRTLLDAWNNRRWWDSPYKNTSNAINDVRFEKLDKNRYFMQTFNKITGKFNITEFDPFYDGYDWPRINKIYQDVTYDGKNIRARKVFEYGKSKKSNDYIPPISNVLYDFSTSGFGGNLDTKSENEKFQKAKFTISFDENLKRSKIMRNYRKDGDLESAEIQVVFKNDDVKEIHTKKMWGNGINTSQRINIYDDNNGLFVILSYSEH